MTGEFEAGQVAELTLTFASGDTVTMDVPIVFACDAYAGLDPSQQESDGVGVPRRPRARARAPPLRAPRPSPTTCIGEG